jgi:hypothetical protein
MAVNFAVIRNPYPHGVQVNVNKTIIEGQLLAYTTTNALVPITSFSITSNVATLITGPNTFTVGGGDVITIAGASGAAGILNGSFTTNSATSTTILIPLTHANVASTPCTGLATLTPNYATGGLALGSFIDVQTGLVEPIGTLGPLAVPDWYAVRSLLGARTYTVNASVATSAAPALVLSYTLAGVQATNAAAVPSDMIGFRFEYVKNAY